MTDRDRFIEKQSRVIATDGDLSGGPSGGEEHIFHDREKQQQLDRTLPQERRHKWFRGWSSSQAAAKDKR